MNEKTETDDFVYIPEPKSKFGFKDELPRPKGLTAKLDPARLENVRTTAGKTTARCPACAESGCDKSGDHLSIKADGKYGCVRFPGAEGAEHRRRIFALSGTGSRTTASTHKPNDAALKPSTPKGPARPDAAAVFEDLSHKLGKLVGRWKYHNAAGEVVFEVGRFKSAKGKTYRPVRRDADGWRAGLPVGKLPLYGLPDLPSADAFNTVFVTEGEKCADALRKLGAVSTCSQGGACAACKSDWTPLSGREVVILPDNDEPGRKYAAAVSAILERLNPPASVQIAELPRLDTLGASADVADWIDVGGTVEELMGIVRTAPVVEPPPEDPTAIRAESVETNGKPNVLLPAGAQSISDAGRNLGLLLAKTERFYIRGGAVVKLAKDSDGLPHLEDVRPAALASDFETVALLCKPDGQGNIAAATCPEQTAKLIAASAAFRDAMRPIHVLTRCPVLIERLGKLIQVSGYDRESGILAAGMPAEEMDLAEAVTLLREILAGFKFATPADHARALAALITPALVFGGLVKSLRVPVDLGEADASQTGKGFRNKLTAAVYAQSVKTVTQQRAGVGSMEETFNMALIRGANFIALDNVRGKIDSPSFESFLTEDTYQARAPYREPVEIDPRRVVIMLTSNKADVTPDLANRCACVRILKQPAEYVFTRYPEGDILEHVRMNQPRYLGAVFAVVQAWYTAGKPRTTETRHDFRPWAQALDWITRNLLDAGPLLDGHRETQARMTNPVLNWLRDVAIEVIRAGQTGVWLRAGDIVDLIAETGTEMPGLPEHGDLTDPETRKNALQATGRHLGRCFRSGDELRLDGTTIERREEFDAERSKRAKEYRFAAPPMDGQPIGGAQK